MVCKPYEFNDGDLNATIMFLEKHLEAGVVSWTTIQYMAREVQYGGRITDNVDRRLFGGHTEVWLSANTLWSTFSFSPDHPKNCHRTSHTRYPRSHRKRTYMEYINKFPTIDSPEVLGPHPNAVLTFRFKEVAQLLDTIIDTQPKQTSEAGKCRGGSYIGCNSILELSCLCGVVHQTALMSFYHIT
jgi:dynein heavy chain